MLLEFKHRSVCKEESNVILKGEGPGARPPGHTHSWDLVDPGFGPRDTPDFRKTCGVWVCGAHSREGAPGSPAGQLGTEGEVEMRPEKLETLDPEKCPHRWTDRQLFIALVTMAIPLMASESWW